MKCKKQNICNLYLYEVCLLFSNFVINFMTSDGCEICWRCAAREQFLNNIPEVLSNLVGQQSARRGAMKVFETLQDPKLNKQLFYVSSALLFVTVVDWLVSTNYIAHGYSWTVNTPSPVKQYPGFVEPDMCSQDPCTIPSPKLSEFRPHLHTLLLQSTLYYYLLM